MAKKKHGPRIQAARPTVEIPSDAVKTKIVPRVQQARPHVEIPVSDTAGTFGTGTQPGSRKRKDHGPRIQDKPRKKKKKRS